MLLKPFTAYVAGVATVAFAHSCASGEPGKLGFGFGIVTAFLLVAWLLGSSSRQQRAGKFLLRLSGVDSKVKTPAPVTCEKKAHQAAGPRDWRESLALPKRKREETYKNAWLDAMDKHRPVKQPSPTLSPDDPNYELFA